MKATEQYFPVVLFKQAKHLTVLLFMSFQLVFVYFIYLFIYLFISSFRLFLLTN